ncbi:MAG: recombinase family protein, partial [Oscillatoriales cyanobacterium RM1_1_9]|nr:recombinase family protein [Oscillatoriales cyanobacterium RM1_1_9]
MKIVAYVYSDPLLETPPERSIWGWEVDWVYQDLGGRQALEQLFQDCQTDPPAYLLLRRFEELGDSVPQVWDRLVQLEAMAVKIIALESAVEPDDSILTRADLIQLLVTIQTEVQTQHRRQRIARGHSKNRLKTLPPPGKAPYGYRRGKDRYVLDRSTAPMVKDFFERFLIYGSLRGAVRYLEQRYGKKISVSTGRRWLTNPVYRGDLAYKNAAIVSSTHAPILSREESAQVDRLLRRNQAIAPRSASAPRSLAGLVSCQECQSLMTISRVTAYRKTREYLYLRPTNCPQKPKCKSLPYEAVLSTTIQRICQNLPQAVDQLVDQLILPDMGKIKAGIQGASPTNKKILAQLPQLVETVNQFAARAVLKRYDEGDASIEAAFQANFDTIEKVEACTAKTAITLPAGAHQPARRP